MIACLCARRPSAKGRGMPLPACPELRRVRGIFRWHEQAESRQIGIHIGEVRVDQHEVAEFPAQCLHIGVEECAQLGPQHVATRIAGHVHLQRPGQVRITREQFAVLSSPHANRCET